MIFQKSRPGVECLLTLALLALVMLIAFAERAAAQTPTGGGKNTPITTQTPTKDETYRDMRFEACLRWRHFSEDIGKQKSGVEIVGDQVRRDADPNSAYDSVTGQNFFWDKNKHAWTDAKTGEQVCPPANAAQPPTENETLRDLRFESCLRWRHRSEDIGKQKSGVEIVGDQVRRDADPNSAYDSVTGQNFFWDKNKHAWIDAKTGECICPKCDETKVTTPPPTTPKTTGGVRTASADSAVTPPPDKSHYNFLNMTPPALLRPLYTDRGI